MEIDIITPEKIVFRGKGKSLTLPALGGEISVLDNHCPLISVLTLGKMIINKFDSDEIKKDEEEICFEIEGGLLEVAENKAHILVRKF